MDINNLLTEIGLNKLEAEVYLYLLTHKPATAYRIGKDINKPTANVYKAIDSLKTKGAVLVELNNNKLCSAVLPNEFLNHYEKNIFAKTHQLKSELKNLTPQTEDMLTYSIDSVPLIFERFENMMNKCKSIAVIDAFPEILKKIKPIIEKHATRNIDIHIESYEYIHIANVDITEAVIGKQALKHWQSQQLNLVIDGKEYLLALLNNKLTKVVQATWSNNNYVACILHAGILKEQTVLKIMNSVETENSIEKIKEILNKQKFFYNTNVPGATKLINKEP
jgi:sugar-specific transcriptional regulator TrmB